MSAYQTIPLSILKQYVWFEMTCVSVCIVVPLTLECRVYFCKTTVTITSVNNASAMVLFIGKKKNH